MNAANKKKIMIILIGVLGLAVVIGIVVAILKKDLENVKEPEGPFVSEIEYSKEDEQLDAEEGMQDTQITDSIDGSGSWDGQDEVQTESKNDSVIDNNNNTAQDKNQDADKDNNKVEDSSDVQDESGTKQEDILSDGREWSDIR